MCGMSSAGDSEMETEAGEASGEASMEDGLEVGRPYIEGERDDT